MGWWCAKGHGYGYDYNCTYHTKQSISHTIHAHDPASISLKFYPLRASRPLTRTRTVTERGSEFVALVVLCSPTANPLQLGKHPWLGVRFCPGAVELSMDGGWWLTGVDRVTAMPEITAGEVGLGACFFCSIFSGFRSKCSGVIVFGGRAA